MLELAELILRTLYEESGGQIQKPVDPLVLFKSRYPKIPTRDIASELTALAAEGLLTVRTDSGAALTTDGLRKLGEILGSNPGSPDRAAHQAEIQLSDRPRPKSVDDDELDIDQIMSLINYREPAPPRLGPGLPDSATPSESDALADAPTPSHGQAIPLSGKIPAFETPTATPPVASLGGIRPIVPLGTQPPDSVVSRAAGFRDPASLPPKVGQEAELGFADEGSEVTRLDDSIEVEPITRRPETTPSSVDVPTLAHSNSWEEERTETDKGLAKLASPTGSVDGAHRLFKIRHELDQMSQELTAASGMPVDMWTEALELTRQLEATLSQLEQVLVKAQV